MRTRSLLILLLAASAVWPAGPARAPVYQKWKPDDVVNQEWASNWAFSPDGRFAVWVKWAPDREKNEHVGQLFRTDLVSLRQVQLTRGQEGSWFPRWSPDGKLLAFLSTRSTKKEKDDGPKAQIWLLDPTGGEPWQLTEGNRAVTQFGWAGGGALVFTKQEEPTRAETKRKDDKDDAGAVEDEKAEPPVRLFRVDVESKKVKRLSDNADRVEALHVSPDGNWALAQHARSLRYVYDNRTKPRWRLHDLKRGASRRALADDKLNVVHVAWSPDSKGYFAVNRASSKPQLDQAGVLGLVYEPLAGAFKELPLNWERGLASPLENGTGLAPLSDGGALLLLADGAHFRAARYRWVGGKPSRVWLTGEHAGHIFDLSATPDGKRLVYVHMTASRPPSWHVAALDGGSIVGPKAIAPLNAHLASRRIARGEVVTWKGAYGDTVEGILYYPHGYAKGKQYPLVVQIHGGPASADLDNWDEHWATPANLLCQRGAFVLRPNYHGSTGYGRKWLDSIADGNYCGPEIDDIEKGVDALIARGLVDRARLGLQGWSNGAILTNVLITKTTRYRAAVSGAGTVEYVSDWASCEFGEAFDRFYLGKSPLEDLPLYRKKSPFHDLDRVRTPTLILFGTEDRVVHPQQGWALYRGLQQLGKVPVRFVQYPGEKHTLKKLSSQRRNLVESLAWFDRHLFGNFKPPLEALKPDSPLAWALKRLQARKVGKAYGEEARGALVPEVVQYKGIKVGRFEVTRAQFAEFDPTRRPSPGQENHPAGGVSFEQARAYCAWLSKKTGRRYRLPTMEEAEKLYDGPRAGENTLDAWAGYAVNPEDARALRGKLGELGEGALIKEVGLGRGTGDDALVFDLGGNVAEWVDDGGKGRLLGGSADTPRDSRGGPNEAGLPYRGLRVVLD